MKEAWAAQLVAASLTSVSTVLSRLLLLACVLCRTLHPAEADGSGHIRVGKLNLVDLAGSERQSKTGATGEHPWQQLLQRQAICTAAEQSCTCRGLACCSCARPGTTACVLKQRVMTRSVQQWLLALLLSVLQATG
jgi:hypothetical protein